MRLITREEAGLRPPRGWTALETTSATAHWGGASPGLIPHEQCTAIWRAWQAQHMDTDQLAPGGAADIAYNMGACQHGYSIEGRGPGRRSAANGTGEANGASFAIVYVGGSAAGLTDEARDAYNDCADYLGADLDHVHQDWTSTGCPGDEITEWVRSGHPRSTPPEGVSFLSDLTPSEQQEVLATVRALREKTQFTNDVLHRIVRPFHPTGDAYGGAEALASVIQWQNAMLVNIWNELTDEERAAVLSDGLRPINDRLHSGVIDSNLAALSDEPYDMSRELAAGD